MIGLQKLYGKQAYINFFHCIVILQIIKFKTTHLQIEAHPPNSCEKLNLQVQNNIGT